MTTRRFVAAALLSIANLGFAQNKTDNVNLVQTFFQDATIAASAYGEGFFQFSDYDRGFSSIDLAVQGAFPLAPKFQLGGGIGFRNFSGNGNSEGGISDLAASGRYLVVSGPTSVAVGGLITLPIGSEDIGEGDLDFSFFGALRHPLPSGLVITGGLALEFVETKTFFINPRTNTIDENSDYNNGLLLAGGFIYPMKSGLSLVTELNIRTEGDYILLSGGLDYALRSG
ncbi:MAG: hypothetical protein AAB354_01775, partial [candidate division KSB1 bacterium]